MLVQGFQVTLLARQGLALRGEMFCLPKTRVSAARPPTLTPAPPWHSQTWPGNLDLREATEQFQEEVMAIWHLGEGRHKEKPGAAAPGEGELGTRCPGLSLFPTLTPLFPKSK